MVLDGRRNVLSLGTGRHTIEWCMRAVSKLATRPARLLMLPCWPGLPKAALASVVLVITGPSGDCPAG